MPSGKWVGASKYRGRKVEPNVAQRSPGTELRIIHLGPVAPKPPVVPMVPREVYCEDEIKAVADAKRVVAETGKECQPILAAYGNPRPIAWSKDQLWRLVYKLRLEDSPHEANAVSRYADAKADLRRAVGAEEAAWNSRRFPH